MSGRGTKGGAAMTPAERGALETKSRRRTLLQSGDFLRELADRESPTDHRAFLSRMGFGNGSSEGLSVALCCSDPDFREQVAAALEAGGHPGPGAIRERRWAGGLLHRQRARLRRGRCGPARPIDGGHRATGSLESSRTCRRSWSVERAELADVRRALELGVDGIVLKEGLEGALGAVVEAVCAGQVSAPSGQRRALRARALTAREKQVLMMVVTGLTNSQIADELFLAVSTVKSHLSSAFGKLGVSSRSEAVAVILDPERGRGLGIGVVPAPAAAVGH